MVKGFFTKKIKSGVLPVLLYCWLFLFITFSIHAQDQYINFGHLSPEDGLSQVSIQTIIQDTFGYMWFGTHDGLNKYDGKDFTVYVHDNTNAYSIPGNEILDLYEGRDQKLWISTTSGVCYLNRELDQFIRIYPDPKDSTLLYKEFNEDESGHIWLSGDNGALYRKALNSDEFVPFYNSRSTVEINDFIILKNGMFWVATSDYQLFEFNAESGSFFPILPRQDHEFLSFHEDDFSRIWVGTDEAGLKIYNQNTQKWADIPHDLNNQEGLPDSVIWDIAPGIGSELFFATRNGLVLVDLDQWNSGHQRMQTFKFNPGDPKSISSNYIKSLYRSRDSIVWFGTNYAGLSFWDREAQKFNHYYHKAGTQNTLSHNVVWSFEEDLQGNFWIGTEKGLNYFNKTSGEFHHYFHDPNDPKSIPYDKIWNLLRSDNGHYWVGASSGIIRMQVNKNGEPAFRFFRPSEELIGNSSFNSIRTLGLGQNGMLWIGTSWGLYSFDEKTKNFEVFHHDPKDNSSLSSKSVRSIFTDSKKRLWIGTDDGLNLYQPESKTFQRFHHHPKDSNSLSNNIIRCMAEDRNGHLWIGTTGGLNELVEGPEQNFQFLSYFIADGLPNETIYAIELDDQNQLWLSTNNGLSKLNPETKQFQNFHEHLGLQSHEFNSQASLKTSDGKLLFGGINGFNYFDPNEVASDRNDYPIAFTEFKVNYKSVLPGSRYLTKNINVDKKVHLKFSNDQMFYFEFKVLDMLHADTRQFSYRLVPFEEKWNEARANNQAAYTNIPPGNYTFQVRSCNSNGQWSRKIGSVQVSIQPAFWQTSLFRLLGIALGIGAVVLFYRWRTRSIYLRQQQLEEMVRDRTTQIELQKKELEGTLNTLKQTQGQLIESEKMASLGQLTAGIAHEINNPVNFIKSNAQALEMDFADLKELLTSVLQLKKENASQQKIDHIIDLAKEVDADYLLTEINDLVEGINRGGERVTDIVNGLKIYSHKSDDPYKEEDLVQLLDSTVTILNHKIKHKNIQLQKNFGSLPKVACHPGKINQVFLNVIDNAIDAMNENGNLEISAFQKDQEVFIEIKDDGQGMDAKTKQKIFEPFFTTKEVGKGTGLGMAICQRIIQKHGGDIQIESQLDQGTTVILSLPIKHQKEMATQEF